MGNAKRTHEEWLALYQQQRGSGQAMKAWCAEKGVNFYTMANRVSRLRKAGLIKEQRPPGGRYPPNQATYGCLETATSSWIEVSNPVAMPKTTEVLENIRVKIGAFDVVVPACFQEAAFLQVCKALMRLC